MTPFTSLIDAASIPLTVFIRDLSRLFIVFSSARQADGLAEGDTEDDGLMLDDGLTDGLGDDAADTVTKKPDVVSPLLLVTKTYKVPGVNVPKAAVNVIEVSPPHEILACRDLLAKA
jgi:hypothetical protein